MKAYEKLTKFQSFTVIFARKIFFPIFFFGGGDFFAYKYQLRTHVDKEAEMSYLLVSWQSLTRQLLMNVKWGMQQLVLEACSSVSAFSQPFHLLRASLVSYHTLSHTLPLTHVLSWWGCHSVVSVAPWQQRSVVWQPMTSSLDTRPMLLAHWTLR